MSAARVDEPVTSVNIFLSCLALWCHGRSILPLVEIELLLSGYK